MDEPGLVCAQYDLDAWITSNLGLSLRKVRKVFWDLACENQQLMWVVLPPAWGCPESQEKAIEVGSRGPGYGWLAVIAYH